jgi:hypothetical protein
MLECITGVLAMDYRPHRLIPHPSAAPSRPGAFPPRAASTCSPWRIGIRFVLQRPARITDVRLNIRMPVTSYAGLHESPDLLALQI